MTPFDVATTPLSCGFTLIEASAGTGKTTAITAILLRLILEEGVPLEKILATTYTELATAELRGRIRAILHQAVAALSGRETNSIANEISARAESGAARHRLQAALTMLDNAAIYTIHGFCARVLRDRAFEMGELFQTEVIAEQSDILREVAQDFIRQNLYPASAIVNAAAERGGLTVRTLVELLTQITDNPAIKIVPEESADWRELARELEVRWRQVRDGWGTARNTVSSVFSKTDWAKGRHRKPEVIEEMMKLISAHCSGTGDCGDMMKCLEFFSAKKIRNATRAGQRPPAHQFLDLCQAAEEAATRTGIALKHCFCNWAREELVRRKTGRQTQSFSDLLISVDEALRRDPAGNLARALRERYPVALIDEFQDTDSVQYSIFSRIYGGSDAKVFLIGDPKQAIYGFRGADVFTYLRATRNVAHSFSLPTNYRSEKKLVEGVNKMFAARENAFVLEQIRFSPVGGSNRAERQPFSHNGRRQPPLCVWMTDNPSEIPEAIAGEVLRLLGANIGARPVRPADIAILVHTNTQPGPIQQALSRVGISSVVYSAASVFGSREAGEMRLVLHAVAEPMSSRRLRAALLTTPFGLTATSLDRLSEQEVENRANGFADYHERWRDHGFVQMMRAMLLREDIRTRLLCLVDGERRLTNWLHLIDLLHHACAENRFGMDGLITWLERRIAEKTTAREEFELRLESDDDAVRLVTIHKSKGLEYAIAFCPYAWRGLPPSGEMPKFHQGEELVLAIDPASVDDDARRRERLAEAVRQFYVALTRAQHRVYFIWASTPQPQKSAPGWLLSSSTERDFVKKGIEPEALRMRLEGLGCEAIQVGSMPAASAPDHARASTPVSGQMAVRKLRTRIDRSWSISSFTSLSRGRQGEVDDEEDEEMLEPSETIAATETAAEGFHAFPRGARGGICLHRIFEEGDFSNPENVRATTARYLARFDLTAFTEATTEAVLEVLRTPLAGTTLEKISPGQRVTEVEFTFPTGEITLQKLRRAFGGGQLPFAIDRLQFAPTRGFMSGSIDLVFEHNQKFYFVDWKTNWLGPNSSFYAAANLERAMAENFYGLQLSIYTLALHRYLAGRLSSYDYNVNFGGAYYVFVRGTENATHGIYQQRLGWATLERLDGVFHGSS